MLRGYHSILFALIFLYRIQSSQHLYCQKTGDLIFNKYWDGKFSSLDTVNPPEKEEFDVHAFILSDTSHQFIYYPLSKCYNGQGNQGVYSIQDSIITFDFLSYYLGDNHEKHQSYLYTIESSGEIELSEEQKSHYPRKFAVLNKIRYINYTLILHNTKTGKTFTYISSQYITPKAMKKLDILIRRYRRNHNNSDT